MPKVPEAWGENRDLTRFNLGIDWETDYGTLTALTGYSYMKEDMINDFNRVAGYGMPLVYCQSVSNLDPPSCDSSPGAWGRIPMGVLDFEPGPDIEEWSQEIRFTSRRDQRLRWQAGGYYFHLVDNDRKGNPGLAGDLPGWFDIGPTGNVAIPPVALPTSLAIGSYIFAPALPAYPGYDPYFSSYAGLDPLDRPFLRSRGESWSLFGSLDFDITDRLKARGELRHTNDHLWSSAINHTPCLSPTPGAAYPAATDIPFADCGDAFYDLRVLDAVGYDVWVKDEEGCAINPGECTGDYRSQFIPGYEGGSARFSYTTWRLGLDYMFDTGWMLYGSVAYSKKPGGINILPSKELVDHTGSMRLGTIVNRFDPEEITAYELGIKGYTPDRRISLDMAVFFNDWQDMVLRQLTEVDPVSGLHFRQPQGLNVNSGDAHVFGWELTTNVAMTDNLSSRLTVAYTDSKMKKGMLDSYALFPSFYTDDPSCTPGALSTADAERCQRLSGDISGKTQMRQPPWTASLSFDYRKQVFGDWDVLGSVSGNFTDKQFIGNDNMGWVPARAVVNMNVGLESPRYTLKFWVRNLFDDDKPLSGYRDIFWTNDSDIYASVPTGEGSVRGISNFDDFPPMRLTVTYPSLRTWGLTAQVRFGGAEK
ncbi:MAG: TonB-dependent receptor [Gammaproteobacteria bacterium]|nr:TonB-dependent receptor [Gammaproteobacteria bacterium]